MITKTAVAIAILAAGITSSANAAGLKFTGAELGVVSNTWFYAGESFSSTHYKAKGKVDITDTVFSLEGRMVLDRMRTTMDLSITQMHLTFGAELSPSTKVGFSLGNQQWSPTGYFTQQYAINAMHRFDNGDFLDATSGRISGYPANFSKVKYSRGSWFGLVDAIWVPSPFGWFGVASIGYSYDLGSANVSASIGRVYSNAGMSSNPNRFSVELTIPFGPKANSSIKKGSQGTEGVGNRSFIDLNIMDIII